MISLLTASSLASIEEVITFDTFRELYSKTYPTPATMARRAAIFAQSIAFITACNANNDASLTTFRCGVNAYSDLTPNEFSHLFLSPTMLNRSRTKKNRNVKRHHLTAGPPAPVDWRAKGAVTPIKNQGSCGSCWAFSTTGSLEGHYQIATGELRVLSEQQLMDCSKPYGNAGCNGGAMTEAFEYIASNGGIDSEKEYAYTGTSTEPCWEAAEKRIVANLSSYISIPASEEDQLLAAAAIGPVSVAIEADKPAFQHYKSGVFDNATCGNKLDHGVLVVGFTADAYIVKNSWGDSWGEKGYIRMKIKVGGAAGKDGICGIAMDASYPVVNVSKAVPIPPPTPGPRPGLPCNCTAQCASMCGHFGMACCDGSGGGCSCMPQSACPQCNPNPPDGPYARCKTNAGCVKGSECIQVNGVPGFICMPSCKGYGSTCPDPSAVEKTTASPFCDACVTTRSSANRQSVAPPPPAPAPEAPNACILACNASLLFGAPIQAECPGGALCQPLELDKDSCDNGSKWPAKTFPCQTTKTCGLCTFS